MTKRRSEYRSEAYPPALMAAEEAARYLAISVSYLQELVAEGRIPRVTHRIGGQPRFRRVDLDEYVERLVQVQ